MRCAPIYYFWKGGQEISIKCNNKEDLMLCKNETRWKNAPPLEKNVYCKGLRQQIKSKKRNDGVFDCVNRHDEVPFKKSEKGELVKKLCTPRSSTSVLVFGCWLIKHVTYLKLRNMLLQDEKMHKMTTIALKIVEVLSVEQLVTTIILFSAWDKSRVQWDNSWNSTQKMRTLEKHCQCSCCDKYNFSRADLDCSGGLLGDILADNETFNALWACKVKSLKATIFFKEIHY